MCASEDARSEGMTTEKKLELALEALRFYGEPWTWARVGADARHCGMIGEFNFNNMYGELARNTLKVIDTEWKPSELFPTDLRFSTLKS